MKSKSFNLKIGAIILALALVAGVAAVPALTASANSAQKDWYGSSASGMMITDENCPVVVESETLTFDIYSFPHVYYHDEEEFAGYDAKVTALYNFYNSANYDVDMTLVFPFGEFPSYVGDHLDDGKKYSVTAGGEKVESSVRHTFSQGGFSAKEDMAKLLDDFKEQDYNKEEGFFKHDTPVKYYTCKFSGIDGEKQLYLKSDYDKTKTAIYYSSQYADYNEAPYAIFPFNGNGYPVSNVQDGTVLYLFVVGEGFENGPQFSFGQSWPLFDDNTSVAAEITEKDITYKDLMLAYYDAAYGVSETDWYNAAVDYLAYYGYLHYSMNNSLMRWYEYRLTVPAGGRLKNEVTAPLYPDIKEYYSPTKYFYEYLLSPAKGWASFGSLDIVVNTQYYLADSSVGKFEKVADGYTLHLDGLPDGELRFSLCADRRPVSDTENNLNVLNVIGTVFLGIELGLQLLVAVILIIVFAVTGKFSTKPKNKKL